MKPFSQRYCFNRSSLVKLSIAVVCLPLLFHLSCRNYHSLLFRYYYRSAQARFASRQYELAHYFVSSALGHATTGKNEALSLAAALSLTKQNQEEAALYINQMEDEELKLIYSHLLASFFPSRPSPPAAPLKEGMHKNIAVAFVAGWEAYHRQRWNEGKTLLTQFLAAPPLSYQLLVAGYDLLGKIEYRLNNHARAETLLAQAQHSAPWITPLFINWETALTGHYLLQGQSPAMRETVCRQLSDHLKRRESLITRRLLSDSTLDPALTASAGRLTNALGYLYYEKGDRDKAQATFAASLQLDPQQFLARLNLAQLSLLSQREKPPATPKEAAEIENSILARLEPPPQPESWQKDLNVVPSAEKSPLLNNVGILLTQKAERDRSLELAEQGWRYLKAAEEGREWHDVIASNLAESELLLRKLRLTTKP